MGGVEVVSDQRKRGGGLRAGMRVRQSALGDRRCFAPRPLPPERGSGRGAYVNTRGTPAAAPHHCPS
ncbi:jg25357 [Pararge aegeria aegeria]|uniref:Jg25357 protein n=1 Tax=Pararge aegeria aegeria TaxID=348720 RepID=A0A8S4S4P9_9NEOP|nr:jg25357 [Pararge aegeria aegeria]